MYACYHGPEGLRKIAQRIHLLTAVLAEGLGRLGCGLEGSEGAARSESDAPPFFDTIRVGLGSKTSAEILKLAEAHRMNFRVIDEHSIGISLDETTGQDDVADIFRVFSGGRDPDFNVGELLNEIDANYPAPFARTSKYLTHPVFNRYHSETEMLRYLKRLESRDLSLTTSMISVMVTCFPFGDTNVNVPVGL